MSEAADIATIRSHWLPGLGRSQTSDPQQEYSKKYKPQKRQPVDWLFGVHETVLHSAKAHKRVPRRLCINKLHEDNRRGTFPIIADLPFAKNSTSGAPLQLSSDSYYHLHPAFQLNVVPDGGDHGNLGRSGKPQSQTRQTKDAPA